MQTVLRNIIGVVVIVGIIYVVTNYSGLLKEQAGVQGAHTDRAKEISQQIDGDIRDQVDVAKDQAMQVKLQDVADFFTRFQKIPDDITEAKDYVQEQVETVLKIREAQKQ